MDPDTTGFSYSWMKNKKNTMSMSNWKVNRSINESGNLNIMFN